MTRTFLKPLIVTLLLGLSTGTLAQQPTRHPAAAQAGPGSGGATAGDRSTAQRPRRVHDHRGSGRAAPAKKMVSLTVADRQNSFVRSGGDVRVGDRYRNVNINVDARPTILRESQVRLDVSLEYRPQATGGGTGEPALWGISERVGVVLESGKPLIISQAFDPTSDRRMTVELKATILK